MNIQVVILAGGKGKRLSSITNGVPKQFTDPLGLGSTLLENTLKRAIAISNLNPCIITDIAYENYLSHIDADIIFEQQPCNTAYSIACATAAYLRKAEYICFMPADHLVEGNFTQLVHKKAEYCGNSIMLAGIKPVKPDTGLGYIETGIHIFGDIYSVKSFVEKPDIATAIRLISHDALCNSGIFTGKPQSFADAFKKYAPDMWHAAFLNKSCSIMPEYDGYGSNMPFDKLILESCDNVKALKTNINWCDLGTVSVVNDIISKQNEH